VAEITCSVTNEVIAEIRRINDSFHVVYGSGAQRYTHVNIC